MQRKKTRITIIGGRNSFLPSSSPQLHFFEKHSSEFSDFQVIAVVIVCLFSIDLLFAAIYGVKFFLVSWVSITLNRFLWFYLYEILRVAVLYL
jgi:hypothetical protein